MDKRIAGVSIDGPPPDSRPTLQPVVYLCQALGLPLKYRFLPTPIGPLSNQLSVDTDAAQTLAKTKPAVAHLMAPRPVRHGQLQLQTVAPKLDQNKTKTSNRTIIKLAVHRPPDAGRILTRRTVPTRPPGRPAAVLTANFTPSKPSLTSWHFRSSSRSPKSSRPTPSSG